jgi:hypothetical protein
MHPMFGKSLRLAVFKIPVEGMIFNKNLQIFVAPGHNRQKVVGWTYRELYVSENLSIYFR